MVAGDLGKAGPAVLPPVELHPNIAPAHAITRLLALVDGIVMSMGSVKLKSAH